MIEFVYFDADGTLFDLDTALRQALDSTLDLLRRLRPTPHTKALTIATLQADRDQAAAQLRKVEFDLERIRLAGFTRTVARCGPPDRDPELAERLTDHFLQHRFSGTEAYPDTRPALEALASTYRLGVLSNGNSHPDRCGLPNTFETVVLAQDHGGIEKPDPRLYEAAAKQSGVPPDRIAMIGDSIEDDVRGAQGAGWHGVWLNRAGRKPRKAADRRAFAEITTLQEAPEALARIASGESP